MELPLYLKRLEKLPHKKKKKEVIYRFSGLVDGLLPFEGYREFIYERHDGLQVIVSESAIGNEFIPYFISKKVEGI